MYQIIKESSRLSFLKGLILSILSIFSNLYLKYVYYVLLSKRCSKIYLIYDKSCNILINLSVSYELIISKILKMSAS